MLIAYLMAVHSTGLSSGEARTVGTTMFLSLGAYLVIELLWPEPELHRSAQIASGVLAGLFIVFVMTPWGRHIAHLAEPSASRDRAQHRGRRPRDRARRDRAVAGARGRAPAREPRGRRRLDGSAIAGAARTRLH